jgi:hypothetical protein
LSGRQVRCPCGHVMKYPDQAANEDDLYDIEPAAAPPSQTARPAETTAVPRTQPLSYQTPRQVDPTIQDRGGDTDALKKIYAPLWLLGGGLSVEVVAEYLQHSTNFRAIFADIGIGLIAGTVIKLVGVLIAAKLRQIDIGSFGSAVLRLAAISVAPGALVTLLEPAAHLICFGWVVLLAIEFLLYFALLGALFDLDESDTWYCVITIFVLDLAVVAALTWVANR